jgi:hypothetical protein
MKDKREISYISPISSDEMPKARERLPQYDECLREFLKSNYLNAKVNIETLPSRKPKVILSSLKWRIRHNKKFSGIRVVMSKNEIYLEKVGIEGEAGNE